MYTSLLLLEVSLCFAVASDQDVLDEPSGICRCDSDGHAWIDRLRARVRDLETRGVCDPTGAAPDVQGDQTAPPPVASSATAPGTAAPAAQVVPELDCEGPGFSQEWRKLRNMVSAELPSSAFSGLQNAHRGVAGEGYVVLPDVSQALAEHAARMAEECLSDGQDFTRGFHEFHFDVQHGGTGGGSGLHRWWVDVGASDDLTSDGPRSPPPRNFAAKTVTRAFCLYGCVAAQVAFLLAVLRAGGLSTYWSQEMLLRMQFASSLLGRVDQALDFVTSTNWGGAPGAAVLLLEHAKWVSDIAAHGPHARPSALELVKLVQQCDPILDGACWEEGSAEALRRRARRRAGALSVLGFGDHAPLLRDIFASLESAAADLNVVVEPIYAGDYYLCDDSFDYACAEDPTKALLQSWSGAGGAPASAGPRAGAGSVDPPQPLGAAGEGTVDAAVSLLAALDRHPHPRAARPDVVLCTNLAVYCWLLRRRRGVGAAPPRVAQVPALHVLGMALLAGVPSAWRQEMLSDLRVWSLEAEMRKPRMDLFAVFQELLSVQALWQYGIPVTFVPSLALAVRSRAVYDPPPLLPPRSVGQSASIAESERGERSVVVLRSAFWRLPGGLVFAALLERFVATNSATHPVRIHWLGRYTDSIPAEGRRGKSIQWQSFETIARHTCALDVPAEFSQLKFRDVYSMGLPLLVPDDPWMLRLLRYMYTSWGQMHYEYGDRLPEVFLAESTMDWPHPPFYNPEKDPPSRLEYWFQLADHVRYPHVQRFASLPQLLDLVVSAPWTDISVRMRAHFMRVVANVERFYRQSLSALLPLGRAV